MAVFRSFNDLVISFLEYLRLVQPELDTKPGTVARDLFVDVQAQQLSGYYNELRNIAALQSMFASSGNDLNKLASNLGATRSPGSRATGVGVFTANNLDVDIPIPQGSVVTASNGITYQTIESAIMYAASSNVYRSTATRLRTDLSLAGITDEFAIEVNMEALTPGTSGNIGRFSLTTQNISGIAHATNLNAFTGGSNSETDSEFRTRILSIFAGSNTGTALGYETAISTLSGVQDSMIVVPGDPLLTRDGTQVIEGADGTLAVANPGTGGKVDIYILGSSIDSEVDSFIYNDQSGNDDPTDPVNDFILGQRGSDSDLSISQRRVSLIDANTLPFQPIDGIISVVGSSSGSNFVEKYIDDAGQTKGNYELIKDTGDFGGSPFGFDRLHFISNTIELKDAETSKGSFNGSDELQFSDVQEIVDITQDVLITNENSTTNNSNRSIVILHHTPVRTVNRVTNLTTGERYAIENQNPDGNTGELNTTGNIVISGSTLPISTDTLQVDYIWVKPFDKHTDFDNLKDYNANRTAQDSVDWSFGNLVSNESSVVIDDGYSKLSVTVTHPITKVLSVNAYETNTCIVNSGYINVDTIAYNIIDIKRLSDGVELFNTDARDGSLSGTTTIFLPTDSLANDGDEVLVKFNAVNLFDLDGYDTGTFDGNIILLADSVSVHNTPVLVNYVANVSILLPESNLSALPATREENKFLLSNEALGEQPTSNVYVDDVITKNLRKAPSHISVTVGSTSANGSVIIAGTTFTKVVDAIIVVTAASGYEIDVSTAIKSDMGVTSIPSTVKVCMLKKLERVSLNNMNLVESVDATYDILNYSLMDNSLDLDTAQQDTSLSSTKIRLAQTNNNVDNRLDTGDIVRVTFYYTTSSDAESLFFSRNGTQITDKRFVSINKVYVGSGFVSPSGAVEGTVVISNYNQPISNSTCDVDYNYTAPKENERVTVTFNHNRLINDATLKIEDVRPITADVLVKAADAKDVNVEIRVVLLPNFVDQEQTVLQDATDTVISFLNTNSLGTTIDSSDIVSALYTVEGIDRVKILGFSSATSGNVLSITANKNEYLRAGTISITAEER